MDALRPQWAPSSPLTAAPLASIDPQHLAIHHSHTGPHTVITHHNVNQVGDGVVDKRPDPLAEGLRVNGAVRRANGRTPRALLGVHLHKMKGPKQVLRAATLWEEEGPLKQLPYFFDDENASPKKLLDVSRLCCRRANTVRGPVCMMSRANASTKSGTGMWHGTYCLSFV